MNDAVNALSEAARDAYARRSLLAARRAIVGFDGFVDILARVVKDKSPSGNDSYFVTTKEFGEYLAAAGGSRSLELARTSFKAGGNMPIVASALGRFGVGVACVGALGFPQKHPAFASLPASCEAYSFADPAQSTALEFDDGKIMLAEMGALHEATWDVVKERVGLDRLRAAASGSALVGFCNWSEIDAADGIWRGMLEEVVVAVPPDAGRLLLFDLADCSKRPVESIRGVIELVGRAARHGQVALSLNANESSLAAAAIGVESAARGPAAEIKAIRGFVGAGSVIVHYREGALSFDGATLASSPAYPSPRPRRSTGGGDNFNAGYCIGALMGFPETERLDLGNAFAGYYRSTGESPDPQALLDLFGLRSGGKALTREREDGE